MGCIFSTGGKGSGLSDIKFQMLKVGDKVMSAYGGAAIINEIRESEGGVVHYVCKLDNWKLAQGQSPTQYLSRDGITQIL